MPRRPAGIYLVAAWLFFFTFGGIVREVTKQLQHANDTGDPAPVLRMLPAVLVVTVLVFLFGLIQLQPLHRKIAIGLLALHGAVALYRVPQALQAARPLLALAFLIGSIGINLLAIWYLTRPQFIEQSRKYREAALFAPKR